MKVTEQDMKAFDHHDDWGVACLYLHEAQKLVNDKMATLEASHKELVEALANLILACPSSLHCDVFHHATHDRHEFTGKCPVKDRYEKSISDAGIALANAEKLTK